VGAAVAALIDWKKRTAMKTQALLAGATLLVALPAAGFPAAVLPAAAVEPAHLVADLDPGLAPFHPSGDHADFSGYVTVGGRVLFFGFLPEGNGFLTGTQCGLWTVDPASGAAERLATHRQPGTEMLRRQGTVAMHRASETGFARVSC
jgi:hypothetical protein